MFKLLFSTAEQPILFESMQETFSRAIINYIKYGEGFQVLNQNNVCLFRRHNFFDAHNTLMLGEKPNSLSKAYVAYSDNCRFPERTSIEAIPFVGSSLDFQVTISYIHLDKTEEVIFSKKVNVRECHESITYPL